MSTNQPATFHLCRHVGVAETTKVVVRHVQTADPEEGIADIFEARVGIAVLGYSCPDTTEDSDPFDAGFEDNFARGFGATEEAAVVALRRDMRRTSEWITG